MAKSNECWACQAELHAGQVYCTTCNHWQNWRRFTAFSSTILSLLIALIAVFGALGPQVLSLLEKESLEYDIRGEYAYNKEKDRTEFRFTVTNLGTVDGLLPRSVVCWDGSVIETVNDGEKLKYFHTTDGINVSSGETKSLVFHNAGEFHFDKRFVCDFGALWFPNHLITFENQVAVWSSRTFATGFVPDAFVPEPLVDVEEVD